MDINLVKEVLSFLGTTILSGSVATIGTLWWQKRESEKQEKMQVFKILMSKRYDIATEESVEALNMIDVVFYSSDSVRNAWRKFKESTNLPDSPNRAQNITECYVKLLEAMAENIGFKNIKWDDIQHHYIPAGLSNKKREEASLRKIQMEAASAQVAEYKKNTEKNAKEIAQIDPKEELVNKILVEAVKNPDSLIKLVDAVEKMQNMDNSKKKSKR